MKRSINQSENKRMNKICEFKFEFKMQEKN